MRYASVGRLDRDGARRAHRSRRGRAAPGGWSGHRHLVDLGEREIQVPVRAAARILAQALEQLEAAVVAAGLDHQLAVLGAEPEARGLLGQPRLELVDLGELGAERAGVSRQRRRKANRKSSRHESRSTERMSRKRDSSPPAADIERDATASSSSGHKQDLCSRAPHCARSTLEAHLKSVLPELGVIKRSEGRRRDVGLNVGRQEGIERIVGAHANPRPQLEDLEPVLDAEVESEISRHALVVARADEIQSTR